jgi:hypothetical protein
VTGAGVDLSQAPARTYQGAAKMTTCLTKTLFLVLMAAALVLTITPTTDAIPTPTPTPVGDMGSCAVTGTVRAEDGPLAGVGVSFEQHSWVRSGTSAATVTAADGGFSFPSSLIHDTDTVVVVAELAGYTPQRVMQGGVELWPACRVDIMLSPEASPRD